MLPRHPSHTALVPLNQRFQFKDFQRRDYARAAMTNGVVLGHDTGGGKTLALFVVPALKVGFEGMDVRGGDGSSPHSDLRNPRPVPDSLKPLAPILLIVPGDLHERTMKEGRTKFRASVTALDSQDTFLRLAATHPRTGRRELPPGYYITSYTQLTGNGVKPFPPYDRSNVLGMMQLIGLTDRDCARFHDERGTRYEKLYRTLNATPVDSLEQLTWNWQRSRREYYSVDAMLKEMDDAYARLKMLHGPHHNTLFEDLAPDQQQAIRLLTTEVRYREYAASIGESRWYSSSAQGGGQQGQFKIKCVYDPSLADLCQDAFQAAAVDEGVKMKGEDTVIGTGVRQIDAAFRLVLTATPIKNRLPDVFRLAWWATGGRKEAHARFPYPDATTARTDFAEEFLISERNLSKEKTNSRRFKKFTPQVCNVHRVWKLMAPVILRRRKQDFGEDIVSKFRNVVRVPLGRYQAAAYKFHLTARYRDKFGGPAIGAQLQALRIAAANPASTLLHRPEGDGATKGEPRSPHTYIPKLHSALKLIQQCLARGEQVILFSAFQDSLDALATRLAQAGVTYCLLDGRTPQSARGKLAARFELGPAKSPYQVMLAGVESMAEGYSFSLCNNVILMAYSWAYDKFEQAINRAHRLTSRWDVNVYPIICERSIDRKLEALIQEKSDAAELVLDGHLMGEQSTEVNLAELLDVARKEFASESAGAGDWIDETELEKEWPALCRQLAATSRHWRDAGFKLLGEPVPETQNPKSEFRSRSPSRHCPSPRRSPSPPPTSPTSPSGSLLEIHQITSDASCSSQSLRRALSKGC